MRLLFSAVYSFCFDFLSLCHALALLLCVYYQASRSQFKPFQRRHHCAANICHKTFSGRCIFGIVSLVLWTCCCCCFSFPPHFRFFRLFFGHLFVPFFLRSIIVLPTLMLVIDVYFINDVNLFVLWEKYTDMWIDVNHKSVTIFAHTQTHTQFESFKSSGCIERSPYVARMFLQLTTWLR